MTTPASMNTVKSILTPEVHVPAAGRRGKRRTAPVVENPSYVAFLRRAIRAAGRRVAAGDVDGLVDLLDLATELDRAIDAAVRG